MMVEGKEWECDFFVLDKHLMRFILAKRAVWHGKATLHLFRLLALLGMKIISAG
jgi:hypothetical protein